MEKFWHRFAKKAVHRSAEESPGNPPGDGSAFSGAAGNETSLPSIVRPEEAALMFDPQRLIAYEPSSSRRRNPFYGHTSAHDNEGSELPQFEMRAFQRMGTHMNAARRAKENSDMPTYQGEVQQAWEAVQQYVQDGGLENSMTDQVVDAYLSADESSHGGHIRPRQEEYFHFMAQHGYPRYRERYTARPTNSLSDIAVLLGYPGNRDLVAQTKGLTTNFYDNESYKIHTVDNPHTPTNPKKDIEVAGVYETGLVPAIYTPTFNRMILGDSPMTPHDQILRRSGMVYETFYGDNGNYAPGRGDSEYAYAMSLQTLHGKDAQVFLINPKAHATSWESVRQAVETGYPIIDTHSQHLLVPDPNHEWGFSGRPVEAFGATSDISQIPPADSWWNAIHRGEAPDSE